jgi:hypothetical protein
MTDLADANDYAEILQRLSGGGTRTTTTPDPDTVTTPTEQRSE